MARHHGGGMSRINHIFEMIDAEQECAIRVSPRPDGQVEIECEDWGDNERRFCRLVVEPDDIIRWCRHMHLVARRARKMGSKQ